MASKPKKTRVTGEPAAEPPKNRGKFYDFVVLPARGVYGGSEASTHAVEALHALANGGGAKKSLGQVAAGLGSIRDVDVAGSASTAYLSDRATTKPFTLEVTERGLPGGPVAIKATAEAERLLRSVGFRLFKQRWYKLIEPANMIQMAEVAAAGLGPDFRSELYLDAEGRSDGPLGAGVTVGVVDTGVDADHPALRHAVMGGRNFVPDEGDDQWGPAGGAVGWHGTHVAGIVAARDPAGRVPEGVAPEAKIRSYRVFGGHDGNRVATIGIINAILSAVDDGCDIVNLSLGGRGLREDGVRDAVNEAWDSGVVCVAAAGNDGRRPVSYPAAFSNCIAISALGRASLVAAGTPDAALVGPPRSAVDPDIFLATFSNIGPQIDFGGPGVAIASTIPGGRYAVASGTSMAAPAVSGATAVALSRNGNILNARRDKDRAAAIFAMLVGSAMPYRLGSFDYEGYGVPR